jgi:hypothetical protein
MKNKKNFWDNINKNNDECWEWQGRTDIDGYGIFTLNKKTAMASRISYILTYGEITQNARVKHFCNNKLCCNPNHLYSFNNYDDIAIKRFWNNVDRKEENICWNWLGSKDDKGYGIFYYKNKNIRASRFSYLITVKNIKDKYFILHSCDNTSCVNPNHLRQGTHIENMADKKIRGDYKGEKIGTSKLKNDQILEIRKLYQDKEYTLRQLGIIYNVDKGTIGDIISRKTWNHII